MTFAKLGAMIARKLVLSFDQEVVTESKAALIVFEKWKGAGDMKGGFAEVNTVFVRKREMTACSRGAFES